MNDAPKIVALALSAVILWSGSAAIHTPRLFVLVMAGMAGMVAGSLVAGRRVTELLAEEVTPMDHREGLAANLVTATHVTTGAVYGLPMSTTHVLSGVSSAWVPCADPSMGRERARLGWPGW